MGVACCSSVLLTEVGWGQCSPGQVGRRALLIPLPFLFQRARQMDEELSRRGSPIPKKVQWFSSQEILFLGSLAFIPGRSHGVSAGRCTGTAFLRHWRCSVRSQAGFMPVTKEAASLGEGGLLRGFPQAAQLGHRRFFPCRGRGGLQDRACQMTVESQAWQREYKP